MRGTVGGSRMAASTHSPRVPLAGDRVCHQVQLPAQAGALRVADRWSHWQNQKGTQRSSVVGASASPGRAPLGGGAPLSLESRRLRSGDGDRATPLDPASPPVRPLLVGCWVLLVAQVIVIGAGAGAGDDFFHGGQGVAVGDEES
jgi:hypothetical protein